MPMFLFIYISCNHPKAKVTAVHADISNKQGGDYWLFYKSANSEQQLQPSAIMDNKYVNDRKVN